MEAVGNDDEYPLAYLITFRTFGTWHHGDVRGSVDRKSFNTFGSEPMPASPKLVERERSAQKASRFVLSGAQRALVDKAIREVCSYRGYSLQAVNVRTNHVHAVVSAKVKPEIILTSFKSYSTRHLKKSGSIGNRIRIWARHGSTRYLWRAHQVMGAVEYVLYNQGDDFDRVTSLADD